MPFNPNRYQHNAEHFFRFAKRTAMTIPPALIGLLLMKPSGADMFFYTLSMGIQFNMDLSNALKAGTLPALPNVETLKLLALAPCAGALGLIGTSYLAVKGLIRGKK